MADIKAFSEQVIDNLEKVIVGKQQSIELIVIGLLCQGHVLIEDVPGVGKTMLARSLARSLDCTFNRIQFTPDMLPSDVTGPLLGTSSLLMRSTAPRPKPRRLCLRQWRNAR
jgi:MoxR-like ATPase